MGAPFHRERHVFLGVFLTSIGRHEKDLTGAVYPFFSSFFLSFFLIKKNEPFYIGVARRRRYDRRRHARAAARGHHVL